MRYYSQIAFYLLLFCFIKQSISAQLVINEVLIDATSSNNDGSNAPNTGEWTELLNNGSSAIDISCYVMTDGDWSVTFPPGTILQPSQIITIGSPFSQIPGLDINIASCNCTSGNASEIGIFTNGNEQLVIANANGQIVDGIYWGTGQFIQTPSFTTTNLFGCASVTVALSQSNPLIQQIIGSTGETETVYLPCDGTGIVLSGNTNPTPDAPNIGPVQNINPNASIVNESCGTLGSITLNPSGGVGPYTFQWTGATGSTSSISGLQDGNYSVAITDHGQCNTVQNFPFVVTQNNSVNISINAISNTLCEGESTVLTASGGSNYTWQSSPSLSVTSTNTATVTPTSTTTYTLEDNTAGCINTVNITIQVNSLPTSAPSYNTPLCEGNSLILSSNTTTATCNWTGPNGFISSLSNPSINTVNQIHAGIYTLTLTENNCSATFPLPVIIDVPITPTINAAGPFCYGDVPFDLTSSAEPGVWSGSGITNASSGIFDPSTGNIGNNLIVFQSNDYCTAPANITVVINANGDASINAIGNICESNPSFSLQTATLGGIWSGTGVTSSGVIEPSVLGPGNYQATYTLSGNCGSSSTLNFTINENPTPIISASETVVCAPDQVILDVPNSNSNWDCEWWVDGNLIGNNCNNQNFDVEQFQCYDLQVIVNDGNGCLGDNIEPGLICGQSPPTAAFAFEPEQPYSTDNLIAFVEMSSAAVQSFWEINGTTFNTPSVDFPINGTEGTVQVCLTAMNAIGCENKVCRIITILDEYGIYVPSAFTPNEDGYNDGFGPIFYNIQPIELNYTFSIFSRDGERVFHSENPKQKWHGNKDGGEIYVQQDSYVWVMSINLPDTGEHKIFRGDVKILR